MSSLAIKPGDKLIKGYYEVLGEMSQLHIDHEMAVRGAFQNVLAGYSRKLDWTLVPEYSIARDKSHRVIVDGAVLDSIKQKMGFWEAKDERDDLEREIKRKIERGYPTTNIIFQAPERAILYQKNVRQGLSEDISSPKNLVELLKTFFEYRPANYDEWKQAIDEFKARLPEISAGVEALIEKERRGNKEFISAFESFYALCRQAINPNLTAEAVERMLVQHLLTERIFRRIFNNPDFTRKNVIAAEVEKVVDSLTHRAFNREAFLASLDHYYRAIEHAAENTETYAERQDLLNTVYERFFQGYSPKEADTHGIVYTPQPIVDFMVRSVEDILKKEFGRSLASRDVHILDPFVGTGNFIVRVMRQIAESDKGALPYKYANELHCNEVMLLPYYIASMNIEHEYMEQVGEYQPFDGICLVDTFELAEPEQGGLEFMTEENTERVKKQKKAPIFVIIGNPPYNAWQESENENNRNRRYEHTDGRVADTYGAASKATNKSALSDPYVKAVRWASDRVGTEGVVAFVTNNAFTTSLAADGMRQCMARDFDALYVLDLGGNVRKNLKLSGTTHNVFGIQVGVSINLLIKRPKENDKAAQLHYAAVDAKWTRWQKYSYLEANRDRTRVEWHISAASAKPWDDAKPGEADGTGLPIGNEDTKAGPAQSAIFAVYGRGVETTRDTWLYSFQSDDLHDKVERLADVYNIEVGRWARHYQSHIAGRGLTEDKIREELDKFVVADEAKIKWSSSLKQFLRTEPLRQSTTTILSNVCTGRLHHNTFASIRCSCIGWPNSREHSLLRMQRIQSLLFPARAPNVLFRPSAPQCTSIFI